MLTCLRRTTGLLDALGSVFAESTTLWWSVRWVAQLDFNLGLLDVMYAPWKWEPCAAVTRIRARAISTPWAAFVTLMGWSVTYLLLRLVSPPSVFSVRTYLVCDDDSICLGGRY